jgi:prophage endopeptidase
MKFNSHYFTFGVMGLLAGVLWFYYGEYHNKAEEYRSLKRQFDGQVIAINTQQTQIQHLAELDKIHTEKLANDKIEIDALRADVAAGRRKLRIKANCPVSETTASGSVGDATTVELFGEAGSTVLDIRESIINDQVKISYLQKYITGLSEQVKNYCN